MQVFYIVDNGIEIESQNPRYGKVIQGTWNSDTKIHTPSHESIYGFAYILIYEYF